MTSSGSLISRAGLLQICLGLGFLLKDVNIVQLTEEGDHKKETPGHIVGSSWGSDELDVFSKYITRANDKVNKALTSR